MNPRVKIGMFISDASFDYKTKSAVVAIKELTTEREWVKTFQNAKNPFTAESFGIETAMSAALATGFFNAVFICDNRSAVAAAKKKFFNDKQKQEFQYVQFLWLPREYVDEIDFLTKNVSEEIKSEVAVAKDVASSREIDKHLLSNIKEIPAEKSTLTKRIAQFNKIKESNYSSEFFKQLGALPLEALEDLYLEESELVEEDLINISDLLEKKLAETIIESLF